MFSKVWGLYWRSFVVVSLIGSMVRFLWIESAPDGPLGTVLKPTVVFGVLGLVLLLSSLYKGGLVSYIFGSRLYLEVATWVRYHFILGSLFLIYAVGLYLIYLSGALDHWVAARAFGSLFLFTMSSPIALQSLSNTNGS